MILGAKKMTTVEQVPIDVAGANERLGLGIEFYKQVLRMFLEEAPRRIRAMRDALEREDAYAFERSAHSLKGSAGNLGVEGIRALAAQGEALGREQRLQEALPSAEATETEDDRNQWNGSFAQEALPIVEATETELRRVAQYMTVCFESDPVT